MRVGAAVVKKARTTVSEALRKAIRESGLTLYRVAKDAGVVGPVMVAWFATLASLGLYHISGDRDAVRGRQLRRLAKTRACRWRLVPRVLNEVEAAASRVEVLERQARGEVRSVRLAMAKESASQFPWC
jgi:hypothetical protein